MNEVCRYCGKYGDLQKSHIIPRSFFYVYEKQTQHIGITRDGFVDVKHFQNGIKEPLLCSKCENLLGKYDEEALKVLYEMIPLYGIKSNTEISLPKEYVDYGKIRKFFISLVWRASIAQKHFTNISIGEYEDIALQILKNEQPDDTNLFFTTILKKSDIMENLITAQQVSKDNTKLIIFSIYDYYICIILNMEKMDFNLTPFSFGPNQYKVGLLTNDDIFGFKQDMFSCIKLKNNKKK